MTTETATTEVIEAEGEIRSAMAAAEADTQGLISNESIHCAKIWRTL